MKGFDHDDLATKCYFRCSQPSDADKDNPAADIKVKRAMYSSRMIIFVKNSNLINIRRS